jgi:hypothetical protein
MNFSENNLNGITTGLSQSTFSQLIFRQKPTPVLKHPLYIFGHMTFTFPDLNLLEKAFLNQLNKTPPNLRCIQFLNEGFRKKLEMFVYFNEFT